MKWLLVFCCLLFAGCSTIKEDAILVLQDLVSKGVITQDQFAILKDAIAGGGDWAAKALEMLGTVAGSVLSALLGVRLWRGSTVARKGLPPQPPVA